MIFLELVLENFGPYLGRQIINLRPGMEDSGPIILFGGMNGGGKTTLMDAIRLALYGQRAQCSTRGNLNYADFLTQCVNKHTPMRAKTRIELAFAQIQEDELITLRVVRYWTREPKEGKDTLGILVNEEWPDKALAGTWDEFIENVLPVGISNLFLFDGEQVKELAELETPPLQVVEAIQSLLGLELAERLLIDLEILATRKRKEVAKLMGDGSLTEIEARIEELKQEQEQLEIAQMRLKKQLKTAEKLARVAQEKFMSEGGVTAEKGSLRKDLNALERQEESQRSQLVNLAAGTLPCQLINDLLQQIKIQGELEKRHQQAQIAQEIIQQRDQRLIDYLVQLTLPSKKLDKIKDFLAAENQELSAEVEESKHAWLGADDQTLEQLDRLLNYEIQKDYEVALSCQQALEKLAKSRNTLERQLATAAEPEVYEQLKIDMETAQGELVKLNAESELLTRRRGEIDRNLKAKIDELESYSEKFLSTRNDDHLLKRIGKVQETLKVFREKLTLKKLNKLEIEVGQCFNYLLHKSDLVHRVMIDTDSYRLSLYDFQGQPVPKHRLSAGEKQLLAIAFLWGLARVSGRHLPIAIDTPLGRLDSSHRSHLVERYFPTASHQVILLSTDTEIGELEVKTLREQGAIGREFLLEYEADKGCTIVQENCYFFTADERG